MEVTVVLCCVGRSLVLMTEYLLSRSVKCSRKISDIKRNRCGVGSGKDCR